MILPKIMVTKISTIIATIAVSASSLAGNVANTQMQNEVKKNETEAIEVVEDKPKPTPVAYEDPHCRTPELPPSEVERIIRETQTMDLNFVALAKGESGLYNRSFVNNTYRGIFQIHQGYHKLDDYCDPAEQVRWLEMKLNAGAKPERLFPQLYKLLYKKD